MKKESALRQSYTAYKRGTDRTICSARNRSWCSRTQSWRLPSLTSCGSGALELFVQQLELHARIKEEGSNFRRKTHATRKSLLVAKASLCVRSARLQLYSMRFHSPQLSASSARSDLAELPQTGDSLLQIDLVSVLQQVLPPLGECFDPACRADECTRDGTDGV